ncbi:MAG: saccharopine dehydrogenase, partial [Leptospiraceae bacterium]|nr:saccharopine dehydrogenase [Leptospiraceae bacterium]
EPVWMQAMIAAHQSAAEKSGARILFSAGFDSLPSDLGVWFLQQAAQKRFGSPMPRIKCRVRRMKGDASGGTMASMKATLKATIKDPGAREALGDPFALTPGFVGPKQPAGIVPEYNHAEGFWEVPFAMAAINTKNVHRSNFLLGHPYGTDFVYDEMMFTTIKDAAMAAADVVKSLGMFGGKSHKKGEGPSKAERDAGFYELGFYGSLSDGRTLTAGVAGDADPGYGSTSKMMAETALCLADLPRAAGGCFTGAALMPEQLIAALQAHAGLTFQLED